MLLGEQKRKTPGVWGQSHQGLNIVILVGKLLLKRIIYCEIIRFEWIIYFEIYRFK